MPHLAPSTLATVAVRHVTVHRGDSPVLVDVSMTIGPQDRIGVIGPNGVGKTTLLRVVAGLHVPDAGTVQLMPPDAAIGYLAQEHDARPGESLGEQLARRAGLAHAEEALAASSAELATGAPGADERYTDALERYLALGAPDFDARRGEVMNELGLPARLLDAAASDLSGGQRAKASLAALLLSRFDVLLLDEPTNDLDFDGLARLERFLSGRQGGLVVVSHDRAFLDGIVTSVVEIDEASHRASEYAGGFAAYLEARDVAHRHAEEAYETYAAARARLQERECSQRQWAVQGVKKDRRHPRDHDKAQRGFRTNRTEKQAAKVRSTERAIERLDAVEKPFEPWRLDLRIKATERSGDIVARLAGATVRRGAWQLGPVDLTVSFGERVALLGPNGSGKSTLIAALLGRAPLDAGTRMLGPSVVAGELGQERTRYVEGGGQLIERFLATTGLPVAEARSLLAKFGIGARHAERPAASLSPGERTRVELAQLMATGTNCLVLDEPTNHLDLPAIEQLEGALGAWPGTLLLVTHDRRLLDAVALSRRITLSEGALVGDNAL